MCGSPTADCRFRFSAHARPRIELTQKLQNSRKWCIGRTGSCQGSGFSPAVYLFHLINASPDATMSGFHSLAPRGTAINSSNAKTRPQEVGNSDSVERSLLYSVGALIESIDYRGRAAPLAPRESCLARDAGLQGPLFHGSARSIEVFSKRTFSSGNRVFRDHHRSCP
jgi:hypothetical protein